MPSRKPFAVGGAPTLSVLSALACVALACEAEPRAPAATTTSLDDTGGDTSDDGSSPDEGANAASSGAASSEGGTEKAGAGASAALRLDVASLLDEPARVIVDDPARRGAEQALSLGPSTSPLRLVGSYTCRDLGPMTLPGQAPSPMRSMSVVLSLRALSSENVIVGNVVEQTTTMGISPEHACLGAGAKRFREQHKAAVTAMLDKARATLASADRVVEP